MDTITLRKLTLKSKWEFTSKYQGWTIEQVMKFHPSSVWWSYTNLQKITYTDDILEVLEEKFKGGFQRIEKPGIDKNQIGDFYNGVTYQTKSYSDLLKIIRYKKMNSQPIPVSLMEEYRKKKSQRMSVPKDKRVYSKLSLQSINHGHLTTSI
jgi:hypothetical protein